MLAQLWSDKFIDDGQPRPPITFRKGLNTVRGGDHAENSIGKSTLLSIIDFAFGSTDFLSSPAIHAVGHHTIWFTFSFEGTDYTYSRDTDEPGYVQTYKDSQARIPRERISIDEFRSDLKERYGLRGIDATFDEIVGRFFRIQEHATSMATQPMRADLDESSSAGVVVLEKLFGLYDDILALEEPYREADQQLRALNAVRKHDLIRALAIKNQREYNEAKKQLDHEQEHLAAINGESDQQMLDLQAKRDNEVEELFAQRHSLRKKAGITRSRIKRLESQFDDKVLIRHAQLERLQRFFPTVKVRELDDIESFHVELAGILDDEFHQQRERFVQELALLEIQIGHVEAELRRKNVPVQLSVEKYKEIGEVAQRVELLTQQTKAWEASLEVRQTKEKSKEKLDSERPPLLKQLERSINDQIVQFDAAFYDTRRIPPELKFDENKKYTYGSHVDDGTGTSDKNLILFDLAILKLTDLPALIHDSPIIKNIADDTVEKILDLYRTFSDKQIFIAFDKDQSYTKHTRQHIEDTQVIHLGEGVHALYGFAWNRADTKPPKQQFPDEDDAPDVAETPRSEQWLF